MKPNSRRGGKNGKNVVSNVRVVDDYAGHDGLYVDRLLGALHDSHSQIRVLCSDCYTITTSATAVQNANISSSQARLTDDFVSFAAQFETFRVRAFRFDIYDINPGLPVTAFFGTFHDEFTTTTQPTFAAGDVIDSPDGQLVPPGTGKLALAWVAHGPRENDFVSTVNGSDFGGLRYDLQQAASAAVKFQIYFKAVIDFRGRR